MLTGKCKEDFEKWYLNTQHPITDSKVVSRVYLGAFNSLKFNKRYGVYVDFFESVGIVPGIDVFVSDDIFLPTVHNGTILILLKELNSREEARKAAIEEANEIYNNRNK